MPVIINSQGLALNVPQAEADRMLSQGEATLPLVGPEGPTSASLEETPSLLSEGFRQPDASELKSMLDYSKYSTTEQQVKTVAERALKTATVGLSTGVQIGLGLSTPEDIAGRTEVNPGLATVGDVVGAVGSLALPGGGAMLGLGKLATRPVANKLGARVLQEAVEGAVFAAGDEVSKAFLSDPDQTVQSVIANVGLGAALGGGIGAGFHGAGKVAAPLWQATKGNTLGRMLTGLKDRAQGSAGSLEIERLVKEAGIDVAPEVRAAMTKEGEGLGGALYEAATASGQKYRQAVSKLYQDASNNALNALGRTADDVGRVGQRSVFEEGLAAQKVIKEEVEAAYAPVSKQYEVINKRFKNIEVSPLDVVEAQERISTMALKEGFMALEDSSSASSVSKIMKALQGVDNLEGLRQLQSGVREELGAQQLFGLRSKVMPLLRDLEDQIISTKLGAEAPELIGAHQAAKEGYRRVMGLIDSLDDRIRVGRFSGPGGFLKNLSEMTPEQLRSRLRIDKDVELQQYLATNMPALAQQLRQSYIDTLVEKASQAKWAPEGGIHAKTLFKEIDKMEPELKGFLFPDEAALRQLEGIRGLVESLPERLNPSGTARALDEKLSGLGLGAGGLLVDLLSGASTAGFGLLGAVSKLLGRELPDAAKLGILKILGTEGTVNPTAFKGVVEMADQAYKASKAISLGAKAAVLPVASRAVQLVAQKDIDSLDRQITESMLNPTAALDRMQDFTPYLPDQAASLGFTTANALQYLANLKPSDQGAMALDPQQPVNRIAKARYERALAIAQKPLIVYDSISNGSLTREDVIDLGTMFPILFSQMRQRVAEEVGTLSRKKAIIPPKRLQTLSLFLDAPLQSYLMPQNMRANQSLSMPPQEAPQASVSQTGLKNLDKISQSAASPQQARIQSKQER